MVRILEDCPQLAILLIYFEIYMMEGAGTSKLGLAASNHPGAPGVLTVLARALEVGIRSPPTTVLVVGWAVVGSTLIVDGLE